MKAGRGSRGADCFDSGVSSVIRRAPGGVRDMTGSVFVIIMKVGSASTALISPLNVSVQVYALPQCFEPLVAFFPRHVPALAERPRLSIYGQEID